MIPVEKRAYTIYRLFDRNNPTITRYIGHTSNIWLRFSQHLACSGENREKDAWIQTPGVDIDREVIEELHGTRQEAKVREEYWIGSFLLEGAPLLNQAIPQLAAKMIRSKHEEYVYYQIEIARDSPLYHQVLGDAKTRGMLNDVSKLIATRLGDWYERVY